MAKDTDSVMSMSCVLILKLDEAIIGADLEKQIKEGKGNTKALGENQTFKISFDRFDFIRKYNDNHRFVVNFEGSGNCSSMGIELSDQGKANQANGAASNELYENNSNYVFSSKFNPNNKYMEWTDTIGRRVFCSLVCMKGDIPVCKIYSFSGVVDEVLKNEQADLKINYTLKIVNRLAFAEKNQVTRVKQNAKYDGRTDRNSLLKDDTLTIKSDRSWLFQTIPDGSPEHKKLGRIGSLPAYERGLGNYEALIINTDIKQYLDQESERIGYYYYDRMVKASNDKEGVKGLASLFPLTAENYDLVCFNPTDNYNFGPLPDGDELRKHEMIYNTSYPIHESIVYLNPHQYLTNAKGDEKTIVSIKSEYKGFKPNEQPAYYGAMNPNGQWILDDSEANTWKDSNLNHFKFENNTDVFEFTYSPVGKSIKTEEEEGAHNDDIEEFYVNANDVKEGKQKLLDKKKEYEKTLKDLQDEIEQMRSIAGLLGCDICNNSMLVYKCSSLQAHRRSGPDAACVMSQTGTILGEIRNLYNRKHLERDDFEGKDTFLGDLINFIPENEAEFDKKVEEYEEWKKKYFEKYPDATDEDLPAISKSRSDRHIDAVNKELEKANSRAEYIKKLKGGEIGLLQDYCSMTVPRYDNFFSVMKKWDGNGGIWYRAKDEKGNFGDEKKIARIDKAGNATITNLIDDYTSDHKDEPEREYIVWGNNFGREVCIYEGVLGGEYLVYPIEDFNNDKDGKIKPIFYRPKVFACATQRGGKENASGFNKVSDASGSAICATCDLFGSGGHINPFDMWQNQYFGVANTPNDSDDNLGITQVDRGFIGFWFIYRSNCFIQGPPSPPLKETGFLPTNKDIGDVRILGLARDATRHNDIALPHRTYSAYIRDREKDKKYDRFNRYLPKNKDSQGTMSPATLLPDWRYSAPIAGYINGVNQIYLIVEAGTSKVTLFNRTVRVKVKKDSYLAAMQNGRVSYFHEKRKDVKELSESLRDMDTYCYATLNSFREDYKKRPLEVMSADDKKIPISNEDDEYFYLVMPDKTTSKKIFNPTDRDNDKKKQKLTPVSHTVDPTTVTIKDFIGSNSLNSGRKEITDEYGYKYSSINEGKPFNLFRNYDEKEKNGNIKTTGPNGYTVTGQYPSTLKGASLLTQSPYDGSKFYRTQLKDLPTSLNQSLKYQKVGGLLFWRLFGARAAYAKHVQMKKLKDKESRLEKLVELLTIKADSFSGKVGYTVTTRSFKKNKMITKTQYTTQMKASLFNLYPTDSFTYGDVEYTAKNIISTIDAHSQNNTSYSVRVECVPKIENEMKNEGEGYYGIKQFFKIPKISENEENQGSNKDDEGEVIAEETDVKELDGTKQNEYIVDIGGSKETFKTEAEAKTHGKNTASGKLLAQINEWANKAPEEILQKYKIVEEKDKNGKITKKVVEVT